MPLRKHHVGQQGEVEHQRRSVNTYAEGATYEVGVSSHVSKRLGVAGERVTWQVVLAPITNWSLTGIEVPAHSRITVAGALVATSQVPGPRKGTSATSNVGVSRPLTSPLEAFATDAFALDLTLEAVSREEFVAGRRVVGTVVGVTVEVTGARDVLVVRVGVIGRDGCFESEVVVVGGVVRGVGVFAATTVVGGEMAGGSRGCRGVELDEAVQVKTRTKRRTGLDHITQ
jgi:hypothetical protein